MTQDGWDWPNGWGDERWPVEPVKSEPPMPMLILPHGIAAEELKNLRPGRFIRVPYWPK